jgi:ABC-type glycerol-3-phosphate transport system permease component
MPSSIRRAPRSAGEWLQFGLAALVVAGMCFPAVWMTYSAFKTNREIFRAPYALPSTWQWQNLSKAWTEGGLGGLYWNSIVMTVGAVALTAALATLAAYAFARLEFPGRRALYRVFLIGLLLPPPAVAIALFTQLRDMGLLNTLWALVFTNAAWSLSITLYLMYGYFKSLKREMEEAARLEGAGTFQVFWHVVLPMVKPAVITTAILNTINIWNELMFALLFISDDASRTLPAGIVRFSGYHSTNYALVFAALTITTVPIMIFYFVSQRHVIRGLTAAMAD